MKIIKRIGLICSISMLMAFTSSSNSERIIDDLVALENNDLQVINAAILHPNGKTHFFVGKYFHVYNTTTGRLEKMGLIGKDGWYGLPVNVDAALMHPTIKKGYIFKGNMYYRYDFEKKKVDKRGIVSQDGWKGLTGPFDAAMVHPTNNRAYFFKGNKYYRYNFSTRKTEPVRTIGKDGWKGIPASIGAMVMHKNGRAYAFKGDHYYRYVFGKQVDKKAVIGRDGWRMFHQLDAVVYNELNTGTYNSVRPIHFIRKGYGYYISFEGTDGFGLWAQQSKVKTITKKRFGYDWYKGVRLNIDAGFLHPKNKKYYFFIGDSYYRYDPRTKKVDKTAKIKDGFGLSQVTAAVGIAESNFIYLFDPINYYKFDISKNRLVASGSIVSKFKGVPNFLDAATRDEQGSASEIRFFKKDVVYAYSFASNKVTRWGISPSGLFN